MNGDAERIREYGTHVYVVGITEHQFTFHLRWKARKDLDFLCCYLGFQYDVFLRRFDNIIYLTDYSF